MKKYIILLLLSVLMLQMQAQRKENRVDALRIAFITKRLSLTPEEAKGFWPIYEQFKRETAELRQKYANVLKAAPEDLAGKSDSEAERMLAEMLNFKQAQVDLAKKYSSEFSKVISKRKLLLLYKAEEDFKKELLKKLQERGGKMPMPPGD